ncbi:RNA polymerase sigma factor [Microbacterium sp. ZW T5_56]|uniref:RNA polymerase sigma factor n=1 Tax=Microbacterium sp. ZW T5_56 TaxID=3378081 RepID=UPI00385322DD
MTVTIVMGERSARSSASGRLMDLLRGDPGRLRRRSISLGVPIDDADDAAQNAALRAWRSLGDLRGAEEGQLCAWLETIIRSTAIDMNRARRDHVGEAMCETLESGQDVAGVAEARERLTAVLRAIDALPNGLRQPLLMSVVDELPTAEIARRLGLSAVAVRQRISRARRALNRF